jgi:hypothetical protein
MARKETPVTGVLAQVKAGSLDGVAAGKQLKSVLKARVREDENPQGTEYDTTFQPGTMDEVHQARMRGDLTDDQYAGIVQGLSG